MIKKTIKSIIKYFVDYKDKNQKNYKELLKYNLENLILTKYEYKINSDELINLLNDLKGTSLVEGLNIVDAILNTINLNGDVCEFGVAQGKTTKLISYLIKNTKKKIYIYDSFKGLPKPSKQDLLKDDIFKLGNIDLYEGKMAHEEKKVISEIKSINFEENRLILNKGFFCEEQKESFKFPEFISFAYIDFDFYKPTLDVLHVIASRLLKESIIIVDDYDFFSSGAKTAVDEWLNKNQNVFEINKIKTINSSFIIIKKLI